MSIRIFGRSMELFRAPGTVMGIKHFLTTLPIKGAPMKILLAVLLLLSISVSAQTPAIPDTPAGHTLQSWLEAFNSGDRARIQDYLSKYEPGKPVENQVNFRNQTGGFDLVSIEKSERLSI